MIWGGTCGMCITWSKPDSPGKPKKIRVPAGLSAGEHFSQNVAFYEYYKKDDHGHILLIEDEKQYSINLRWYLDKGVNWLIWNILSKLFMLVKKMANSLSICQNTLKSLVVFFSVDLSPIMLYIISNPWRKTHEILYSNRV
jgi:hypothetical protein